MKLLSNLDSLDMITDGEDRKLEVFYIDLSVYNKSTNPFVFNDIKPGLYINTNPAISQSFFYFKLNDSTTGVRNNYAGCPQFMVIKEDPSTATEATEFCYMIFNSSVKNTDGTISMAINRDSFKKRESVTSKLVITTTSTYFLSSLVGEWVGAFCNTTGSLAEKSAVLSSYRMSASYFILIMANANTAQSALTLSIAGIESLPIYINGEPSSATNYTLPAGPYIVYYDGTKYYFNTDGTIPRVIHGDDSIKRIVELDYEDYKELEDNDEVDPDTEYHIPESGSGSSIETIVRQLIQEDAERKHPVGSLEFNTSGTNPSSYLGFGTWEMWGEGRVPVGVDTSQTEFDTVEKMGGSKYMQRHYHDLRYNNSVGAGVTISTAGTGLDALNIPNWSWDHNTQNVKGSSSNLFTNEEGTGDSENLQPYITCYMWKRTA